MAFNRQTFRTRTITAIVFVMIMLAGLLWNQWSFFILFSVIHFGCWFEYQSLLGKIDQDYRQVTPFHRYGIMLAGWCIMLYFTRDVNTFTGLRLQELGWWTGLLFIIILPIYELLFSRHIQVKNIGYSLSGLLYISLSLGLMIDLYNINVINIGETTYKKPGYFIPAFIIGSIWINDTMAYIIGSLIGKHPLSKISPKKTWEGTIGGIILSMIVVGLVSFYALHFGNQTYYLVVISAISAIGGTFGDLFQSKLKRMAGVKDSGSIMPGHGGFLDRFDSMLFAITCVWVFIKITSG